MILNDLTTLAQIYGPNQQAIRDKFMADMIYYLVIEQVVTNFGSIETNAMSKIHPDALGAARDQMAMLASDQGLIRYRENGLAYSPSSASDRALTQEDVRQLIQACFKNSEALQKMISTRLASQNQVLDPASGMYADAKVDLADDNVLFDETMKVLDYISDIDNPNSLAQKVFDTYRVMTDGTMIDMGVGASGGTAQALQSAEAGDIPNASRRFGTKVREYRIQPDGTNAATLRTYNVVNISPLMPEFRQLRNIGVDSLGLYPNSEKGRYNENSPANQILQFDPEKGILYPLDKYEQVVNSENGSAYGDFYQVAVSNEYLSARYQKEESYFVPRSGDFDVNTSSYADMEEVRNVTSGRVYNANTVTSNLALSFQWRMVNLLEKYSNNPLTEADIQAIKDMFRPSSGNDTLFGSIPYDNDSDVDVNRIRTAIQSIQNTADRYFDYVEHMCSKMRETMPSHEFEIHVSDVAGMGRSDVKMLYFTGLRTDDYQRASRDDARFLGVYLYVDYNSSDRAKNNDAVHPGIGDLRPGGYNTYAITSRASHGDQASANKYMHSRTIDNGMIANMQKIFDTYISDGTAATRSANNDIVISRIRSRVGSNIDVDDISEWIRNDENNSIMISRITKLLLEDRDEIVAEQTDRFLSENAANRFSDILEACGLISDLSDETGGHRSFEDYLRSDDARLAFEQDPRGFLEHIDSYMDAYMKAEYDVTSTSYIVDRCVYIRYLNQYVKDVMADPDTHIDAGRYLLDPSNSDILKDALTDVFGSGLVVKTNMCSRHSRHYSENQYRNMLQLASYTPDVTYDAHPGRDGAEIQAEALSENPDTAMCVQLFSMNNYDTQTGNSDAVRSQELDSDSYEAGDADDDAEAETEMSSDDIFFSDHMWHVSTFAKIGRDTDRNISAFLDDDISSDSVIYRATHPLQTAAMKLVDENLSRIYGQNYDPKYLNITENGIIYYKTDSARSARFKIGPVLDERAYIHAYNDGGQTRFEPVVENGALLNDVDFGPLDLTKSLRNAGAIPNRIYGVSARADNYDGYGHDGQTYVDRMRYFTYHAGVLNRIQESMNLYAIARHDHANTADRSAGEKAMSIFYTNVSGSSLLKCYRTNTYVIDSKKKCQLADHYLSNSLDPELRFDILAEGEKDDPMVQEQLHQVANLWMSQCKMYRNRVVMQNISLDQNIGLHNTVLNLAQCSMDGVLGDIDRLSLLRTDAKSARVGMFSPNPVFDSILSATAKRLGAVAFLTTDVELDRTTGKLTINADANDGSRCTMVADGITDFDSGEEALMISVFRGGQAVDRFQLSFNGWEKSLNYAENVKFAMVNLGHNMEDGYIVAKRSAYKFGHFGDDGRFHLAVVGDKIGDAESGNKGVIAKIVDTDLNEYEFQMNFVKEYLRNYYMNYGNNSDNRLRQNFLSKMDQLSQYALNRSDDDYRDARYAWAYGDYPEGRTSVYDMDAYYEQLMSLMLGDKVEPFYSDYMLEYRQWQIFHDNPDLDVAVTNVCVLTRSNPSLLMYIAQNRDLEPKTQTELDSYLHSWNFGEQIVEVSDDMLILRKDVNAEYITDDDIHVGACGRMAFYVDVNTADHKNKYYGDDRTKPGRKYGTQEIYALMAKHCDKNFLRLITMNDNSLPNRIEKLNRKLIMNGFAVDISDGFTVKTADRYLIDIVNAEGSHVERSDVNRYAYRILDQEGHNRIPETSFIDIEDYASEFVDEMYERISVMKADDLKAMMESLKDLDFGRLLTAGAQKSGNQAQNDFIEHFFYENFGVNGGNYILMPETLFKDESIATWHVLNETPEENNAPAAAISGDYGIDYGDDGFFDMGFEEFQSIWSNYDDTRQHEGESFNLSGFLTVNGKGERVAAPLFLSSREILDDESNVISSHVDDKTQLTIYKAVLAHSIMQQIYDRARERDDKEFLRKFDNTALSDLNSELKKRVESCYERVGHQRSMDITDLSKWLKKNIYNVTFHNSMTCVWSGDPTLEIDEAGISFDQAKKLGLLKPRNDPEAKKLPDTYENMTRKYLPFGDDDFILVNRSPGQTTGCIRALRPKIVSEHGTGLKINPALATIFDGDFDGDTVGVNVYRNSRQPELTVLATKEIKRSMTMQANLIQTSDYTEIPAKDGKIIKYVNPIFIAGNADIAIAKHAMKNEGMDVQGDLDRITIRANIVEQYKQICYELTNDDLTASAKTEIRKAREKQIKALASYDPEDETIQQYQKKLAPMIDDLAKELKEIDKSFKKSPDKAHERVLVIESHLSKKLDEISNFERENKKDLAAVYKDVTKYLSKEPCFTRGYNDFEMISNIVDEANISKKGKAPQLNALLMYAGVHADCPGGSLCVAKNTETGKFEIQKVENGGSRSLTEDEKQYYSENLRMDYKKAVSEVPKSRFKTQVESNIVAQSDKSDATGFGGAVAQKMQKIFGPSGHGELGLRISGPITQMFLDAKQNVQVCEKNLTVGKFILDKVCKFKPVAELMFGKQAPGVVRNGQFTQPTDGDRKITRMTVKQSIDQIDNFLQMMGLPELSPIDRTVMKSCLEPYADQKGVLAKSIIKDCDKLHNKTYALMYGGNQTVAVLKDMAREGESLYKGSIFQDTMDAERVQKKIDNRDARKERDGACMDLIKEQVAERSGWRSIVNSVIKMRERSEEQTGMHVESDSASIMDEEAVTAVNAKKVSFKEAKGWKMRLDKDCERTMKQHESQEPDATEGPKGP